MPPALKFAIYARKSTESEDRQVASIGDQVGELHRVAERERLNVVGVYTESQSAKAPGRPVFNEVLGLVRTGKINGILAWKLDRLARNPVDGGSIAWELQKGTLQAIRTHERVYLPGDNVLSMAVEFGMAAQYIQDLSAAVRRGMKSLASQGYWHSIRTPYGYIAQPTGEGKRRKLAPDPERAEATSRFFVLLGEGYTLSQARTELLRDYPDFPTPTNLAFMAHNPHYLGHRVYGRHVRQGGGGGKLVWQGAQEWTVVENTHPALVSKTLFNKVQKLLASRDPKMGTSRGIFPLAGILFCGRCGKSLSGGDQRYHLCYTRRHYHTCSLPAIHRDRLLSAVLKALDTNLFSPEQLRRAVEEALAVHQRQQAPKARAQAQRHLGELERRQARLLDAIEEGAGSVEKLAKRLAALEAEIAQARTAVEALVEQAEQVPVSLEMAQALAGRLQEQIQHGDPARRQQAMRAVVRRVEVGYPGGTIVAGFAGAEVRIGFWLVPPPVVPEDLEHASHLKLAQAVRLVRRFIEDTSFSSRAVNSWTRQQCQEYLRAHPV